MPTSWGHDHVLSVLAKQPSPIGSLVEAFPGRAAADDNPSWLDPWFRQLIEAVAEGQVTLPKIEVSSADGDGLSLLRKAPVAAAVRFVSLRPHYFRGFRDVERPIDVDADLIVFQGRNSSGKTGISEALEWLLTGALSRRVSRQYGDPRELANCVSNEFRPKGTETWVEGTFRVDEEPLSLRRVLRKDYAATSTSRTESEFYRDGEPLSADEQIELLGTSCLQASTRCSCSTPCASSFTLAHRSDASTSSDYSRSMS